MNNIKIIENNEIDIDKWELLLKQSPFTSFFQSKLCFDFYSSLSFMKAFAFGVLVDDVLEAVIVGYIVAEGGRLKSYFSKRAIILGGPLLSSTISDKALTALLKKTVDELSSESIYVEIRNSFDYSNYKDIFKANGFDYSEHLNYKVDLSTDFEKRISESKRRQFRQAIKQDVELKKIESVEELNSFYLLLNNLYSKHIKKPLFPIQFFNNLLNLPNCGILIAKNKNSVVIGGLVYVMYNKVAYEWFVVGDRDKHKHLYPSVAVTYGTLKMAKELACTTFDFMGAGKPDKPYGVRDFKKRFGGELVEYGRYKFIIRPLVYKISKTYLKALIKLKRI